MTSQLMAMKPVVPADEVFLLKNGVWSFIWIPIDSLVIFRASEKAGREKYVHNSINYGRKGLACIGHGPIRSCRARGYWGSGRRKRRKSFQHVTPPVSCLDIDQTAEIGNRSSRQIEKLGEKKRENFPSAAANGFQSDADVNILNDSNGPEWTWKWLHRPI